MAQRACPKCQAVMMRGFVIDNSYGSRSVSSWLEGEPKRSIWVGVKFGGQKPIEIETWRCVRCGFLENFAKAP